MKFMKKIKKIDFTSVAEKKYISNQLIKISNTIRDLRIELNMSQEELAEMTAVSVSTIKAIEQNKRTPSLPMLLKILFFIDQERHGKPRECLL